MRILQMSVQAGLLITAIVIIRAVALNRLPKTSFLVLWGVALLRMLFPFSFTSRWSIYSMLGNIIGRMGVDAPTSSSKAMVTWSGMAQAQTQFGNMAGQNAAFSLSPLTAVWLAVMVVLLLAFALWIFRSYRELRFAIPIKSDAFVGEWVSEHKLRRPLKILYSDRINTPLSVGIVRPRIILPKTMDTDDKRLIKYVLTHEYYHIRRFDMLWKLLALCAVCVHWFNPLAWVMLVLFNRDLEITCDEMVLRHFGGDRDGKQSYAYSLIDMAETRGRFSPINSYFSKNAAEERVVSIMKYKKSSVLAILIAVIMVMGLTTAFAASGSDQPLQEVNDVAPHEELYDGNGNLIYSHTADKSINENYLDIEVGNTRFFIETLDCIDGVSAEHVEANAHMAVYTNSGQTWSLKAGQTATLTFDVKPTINEGNGWSLYLGYVKDGEYEVCSNPRIPSGITTLSLTVPADGEYNFFFTNVSAGSIYVNSCSITIE